MLARTLLSTLLQLVVFAAVPFLVQRSGAHRHRSFFHYIGLERAPGKAYAMALLASILFAGMGCALVFMSPGVRDAVHSPASTTGALRLTRDHVSTLLALPVIAWFKTALSEEILFRGFIAKRCMARWGNGIGNLVQAAVFGLVHAVLFWKMTGVSAATILGIFFFSALAGWSIARSNARLAHGSILPGWVAHGLGNTISYVIIVFLT